MVTIHLLRFLTVSHFIERTGLQKLQRSHCVLNTTKLQTYNYTQRIQASWNEFQRFKEIQTHTSRLNNE